LHDAGHGYDRHRRIRPLAHEDGKHELRGSNMGLGDETTECRGGTQPPGPDAR
jgi:hypothetical protein